MHKNQYLQGFLVAACTGVLTLLILVETNVDFKKGQFGFRAPEAALAWGSSLSTLCQNLELYYKFDEVTGATLLDTSENTRTGSLIALGNDNRYTNVPSAITFLNSGSLQFTGGAYAQILTGSAFSVTGDLSIAGWVRPHGSFSGKDNVIVSYGANSEVEAGNVLYELILQTDGSLRLRWESDAGSDHTVDSTTTISTSSGTWAHFAATRDDSAKSVSFYWNGSQVGTSVSYSTSTSGGSSGLLFLGTKADSVGDSASLEGQLDDLRIYSTVLSASEVSSLHTTGDSFLGCTCGDATLQSPEQCDNGDSNSDETANACRTNCRNASCGDSVVDSGEECDGGGETSSCNSNCTTASCGDGVLNTTAGEECDNGGSNSNSTADACRTTCVAASCGDGVVDTGEQCDDGNSINTDGCTNTCKNPTCGDGYVQASNNETCEPPDTDICASNCTDLTGGGTSNSQDRGVLVQDDDIYESRPPPPEGCGNRVVQTELGEECDEGVRNDVGACSYDCKLLYCGDGIVTSNIFEQCEPEKVGEDSNGLPIFAEPTCTPTGRSCSVPDVDRNTGLVRGGCKYIFIDVCEAAATGSTTPTPDNTGVAYCGNGILEGEEACDQGGICQGGDYDGQSWKDNNNVQTCMAGGGIPLPVGGDGCSATCQFEACGDGIVQPQGTDGIANTADDEQCDNGMVCANDPTKSCSEDKECSFRMFCQGNSAGQTTCGGTLDGDSCQSDFDCIFFSQCVYNDVRDPSCTVDCKKTDQPAVTTTSNLPNERTFNFKFTLEDQTSPQASLWGIAKAYAASLPCGSKLDLVARVISSQPDPNQANNLDTQSVIVDCDGTAVPEIQEVEESTIVVTSNTPGSADVTLELIVPPTLVPGHQFTATVRVRNYGPSLLEVPARVLMPVPAGVTVSQSSLPSGCQLAEGSVECVGITLGVFDARLVQPVCGNGLIEGAEACDDSNLITGDGCDSSCQIEVDEITVPETEEVETPEPGEPVCGNGIIEAEEVCDDGERNSDTDPNACRLSCAYPACGDGVIDAGEECDAGEGNSDADPDTCRSTCELPRCGDGIKDSDEQCDGSLGCLPSCSFDQAVECGDGVRQGTEECDDGNAINGDGCSNECKEEPKLSLLTVCGNGKLEEGEQCDDGNLEPGDGCDTQCVSEEPTEVPVIDTEEPVEQPIVDSVYNYDLGPAPQSPLTAQIIPLTPQYTPIGDTGPGALVFLSGGAVWGLLQSRRRKRNS